MGVCGDALVLNTVDTVEGETGQLLIVSVTKKERRQIDGFCEVLARPWFFFRIKEPRHCYSETMGERKEKGKERRNLAALMAMTL